MQLPGKLILDRKIKKCINFYQYFHMFKIYVWNLHAKEWNPAEIPAREDTVDLQNVGNFLKTGIWRIRASRLPAKKSFMIRQLRMLLLSLRGFQDDQCQLRASALTFYSLLSVVPILAMAFGIAKGFGFEQRLEKQILQSFPDQQEVALRIIEFARSFLEKTQGGLIAGVGVALLFWTVIKVLGNIEKSFNDIWGIKTGRSLGRKFSDYLSLMLIAPLLFVMSSSMTVLVTSHVTAITQEIALLGAFSSIIFTLLKLLPYVVIWVLFTFLYVLMPNTKVRFRSALVGGILAGTVYQLVQWAYIKFQIGVSSYGAIYGSFAALPLFLIWMQISWFIVLFGAEISFAEQNVETYEFEPDCLSVSHAFKRLVALRITHLCVRNFQSNLKPWGAEEIANSLELPIRLIREILFELTASGILSEVRLDDEDAFGYQPGQAVENLTLKEVMEQLDRRGTDSIPLDNASEWDDLAQRLETFGKILQESDANVPLKDL